MTNVTAAYFSGWEAGFTEEWDERTNPYQKGTVDHEEWAKGYQEGLRDWDSDYGIELPDEDYY